MQIEIDMKKLEKRVWVKPTATRKGHYRKIKGAEKIDEKPKSVFTDVESTLKQMRLYVDYDKRVTKEIVDSVREYTAGGFNDINSALRKGVIKDYPDIADEVNNISEFIQNAPKFSGVVYRGMADVEKGVLFDEFVEKLKNHEVIEMPSFVSCSVKKEMALEFTESPYTKVSRNIFFEIKSKNGVLLDGASDFQSEGEVLFDYDSKFKIVSVEEIDDGYSVKLKEL